MVISRRAQGPFRGFRWHIEWTAYMRTVSFWVPWRHPSEPLIYWAPVFGKKHLG